MENLPIYFKVGKSTFKKTIFFSQFLFGDFDKEKDRKRYLNYHFWP